MARHRRNTRLPISLLRVRTLVKATSELLRVDQEINLVLNSEQHAAGRLQELMLQRQRCVEKSEQLRNQIAGYTTVVISTEQELEAAIQARDGIHNGRLQIYRGLDRRARSHLWDYASRRYGIFM